MYACMTAIDFLEMISVCPAQQARSFVFSTKQVEQAR
jgi:hypothetical protein